MKTTINPEVNFDDTVNVLRFEIVNPEIVVMTQYTPKHTTISIHNIPIEVVIELRDKLNKIIETESI